MLKISWYSSWSHSWYFKVITITLSFFTFIFVNWKKCRFHNKVRLPVLDGITHFGMTWLRFDYFWNMSVCLCVRQNICGKCSSRVNAQNFMTLYIKSYSNMNDLYQLLEKIAQQVALFRYFFRNVWDRLISVSSEWNCTKIYMQIMRQ